MLKKHSQIFEGLFAVSDLLVVMACWLLSYWLRFSSGYFAVEKGVPPSSNYFKMLIFVALIWFLVFRNSGLYKPMRGISRLTETWIIIKANAFSILLLVAATYLFWEKSIPFSRLVFGIFACLSTLTLVISRGFVRSILRLLRRRGYNLRYALIVGAGELAAKVVTRLRQHPEYGIELIGCLASDDLVMPNGRYSLSQTFKKRANEMLTQVIGGIGDTISPQKLSPSLHALVVGRYSDLPSILERGGIDQIIVAMPHCEHKDLDSVMALIGDSMVDVKIIPDMYSYIQLGSAIEEFDGLPVVSIASTPLSGFNVVLKRLLDIFLSGIFLLLISPIMILAATLVKLSSPGPVFFTQERMGLDGRLFKIIKFRTMRTDAEKQGAQFAVKNDPRATRIGKIMRKLSIDELPQLFNVILGHMSLVGPRPERQVFIQEFRQHFPKYMLRHKVQAGMTGWAQINGWRGNTSIEKRIEHDLYYIENWSLGLDLKIVLMTLVNGFFDRSTT